MGKLILLVDDSATIQQLVRLALADEGIEVFAASTAAEARHWLDSHSPDLILADLCLPDDDGLTLIRRLRSTPETARTPVIVLAPIELEPDHARRAGADAVLSKPFDSIALLVNTVREFSARPSAIELPPESEVSTGPDLDKGMDSILELDDLLPWPSSEIESIPYDQIVSSLVPLIAELVAERVAEKLRERLSREVVERAVPEVVRTVMEMLAKDEPANQKTPSDSH